MAIMIVVKWSKAFTSNELTNHIYIVLYCISICNSTNNTRNKFALLWGEAQLCLPYVCL